jgi:uncharacterized protein with PQ loop repeat
MIELAGWIGAALLTVCSVPQAYKSWKEGHSSGVSPYMLWLWLIGMIFTLVYFCQIQAIPAIVNYCFNIIVAGIIIRYYHFPRNQS